MVALLVGMLLLFATFRRRVPFSPAALQFLVFPPDNSYMNTAANAAVSPDGHDLAFVVADSTGKELLWIRPLDSLTARPLAGTEGAAYPFWSPDGRQIGFFSNFSYLKKVDVSGGPPITVASAIAGNGGTWNHNDVIVFGTGSNAAAHIRVPAAGGKVYPITKEGREQSPWRGAECLSCRMEIDYLYDAPASKDLDALSTSLRWTRIRKLLSKRSHPLTGGLAGHLTGNNLFSASNRRGQFDLYQRSADGSGKDELLYKSEVGKYCQDWSPDSKSLLFMTVSIANRDIWTYYRPLEIESPFPFSKLNFLKREGGISPDGKWVAYYSDESGDNEVYVRSVLPGGGRRLVSTSGGSRPKWRRDGKEIFYLSANGELMAAAVKDNGSSLETGIPKPLFQMHLAPFSPSFDVTPDGQRILAVSSSATKLPTPITVVVNWDTGLKRQ